MTDKPRVRVIDGKFVPIAPAVLKPKRRRNGPKSDIPTPEVFAAAYQQHGSVKAAAKALGCAYVTALRWQKLLFPDAPLATGHVRYEVVQVPVTGPPNITVYSVRDLENPTDPAVDVWWDGTAHCTLCKAPGKSPARACAIRCGHARVVLSRLRPFKPSRRSKHVVLGDSDQGSSTAGPGPE